jgi:hypothetical protein
MATGWPTHDDVCKILRLQDPSDDDDVVESARLAAIAYCVGRIDRTLWPVDVNGDPVIPPPSDTSTPLWDPVFEAVLLLSARFYRRRDSLDGTIGWGDMGVIRVGVKDNDVEALLAGYMPVVVG